MDVSPYLNRTPTRPPGIDHQEIVNHTQIIFPHLLKTVFFAILQIKNGYFLSCLENIKLCYEDMLQIL